MVANATPVFTNVPVIGVGTTALTADTGYGGVGGTAPTLGVTVLAGSTNGTKIEEINVMPTGATTACIVNLFLFDGTTYWLYDQVQFGTVALAQSALQAVSNKPYANLILPSGWSLVATCTVTQTAAFVVQALGGTF